MRAGVKVRISKKRKHVPTRKWREKEAARLVRQAERNSEIAAEQAAEARQMAEQARLDRLSIQDDNSGFPG